MIEIIIGANEKEQRLDRFLLKLMKNDTRTNVYRYIRKKIIKVNGKKAKENYFLVENDKIQIYLPNEFFSKMTEVKKELIIDKYDLDIVYEDEHLLIINKPAGLLTHPDQNEYKKTLSSYVNIYLRDYASRTFKPASIQRLDKNTSGLVIFAKDYDTLKSMNELMRERKIKKYYQTIVHGQMKVSGEIIGYILKDEETNRSVLYKDNVEGSKRVHTKYKILNSNAHYTELEVEILTGRSHQIRASLASIGHPIVGDIKYGGKRSEEVRLYLLHAYRAEFGDFKFKKESKEISTFIAKELS